MTTESKPSRTIAILLAMFTGCGVGHYYAGLKRRAIVWFASVNLAALVLAVALPVLGRGLGFGVPFGLFFIVLVGGWAGPIIDLARTKPDRFVRVPGWKVFLFWLAIVCASIIVRLSIRGLLLEAFKIPAGSMTPTLLVGDHIMADKIIYRTRDPQRGEVIVFAFPEHTNQDFVKRVIAGPGDRLEMKNGHPWINDWEVPHCKVGSFTMPSESDSPYSQSGDVEVEFLQGEAYLTFYDKESAEFTMAQGPYAATGDEYWVLGDNRNNSHDSRMWFGGRGGGVPKRLVKGKALFTWLSVSPEGVDWSRTGVPVSGPHLPARMRNLEPELARCMQAQPAYEKTVPPRL